MTETTEIKLNYPLFTFHVLVERDKTYSVFVARCLETGSTATADDPKTAEDMIRELLVDESSYAIKKGTIANLYSRPSSIELWRMFAEISANKGAKVFHSECLEIAIITKEAEASR